MFLFMGELRSFQGVSKWMSEGEILFNFRLLFVARPLIKPL